jgi:diguanylate cyclase (GGDEF)-like protein
MRREIVRGGLRCGIIEAFPGSLDGLPELLAGWNVASRLLPASAEPDTLEAEPVDLHLVDTASNAAMGLLRDLVARRRAGGALVIALCRRDSATAVSHALAIGCDDALAFPLEDIELEIRIGALAACLRAEREQARRRGLLARYGASEPPRPRPRGGRPRDARPQVLLAGIACENQVKVAHGAGPAALAYADSTRTACRLIAERPFDVIIATLPEPGASPVLLPEQVEEAGGGRGACLLLAGPLPDAAAIEATLAAGFHDIVNLPQPPELIRLRLEFWLRLQRLRRWLREPPTGPGSALARDALSGVFNQGFMLDYIDAVLAAQADGRPLPLLALALTGLPEINRHGGHAVGNRLIAEAGQRLRYLVRAEDMAAHQGNGQFVVVMDDTSEAMALQIAARVEATLRRVAVELDGRSLPLEVAVGVALLRRRDEIDRPLARAFRELWAARPRVA